ncbi:uncharacterized protein LOC135156951 [Lytechinus pictus]|uniref:uncharacterized protein LOC135156951 n=1 Tax=Lytechinus pictus TaxID=7653 RepID=UPI0030B9F176
MSKIVLCHTCSHSTEAEPDPEQVSWLEEFLPVNYKHHICSVKEGVDGVNITLRLAVSTEEGAKKWLESMQKSSLATFRVERTHPSSGEKVLYKTEFRCQHNTKPRTATANQRRGSKNTSCPAGLSIIVKVSTFERSDGRVRKSRSSDPHLPDHPMVVKFKSTHNHLLRSADALKHRDVSEDVKEKFLDLFSKGYTPSKALALHKYDLQLQHNDNYVFVSADRAITPDLHYTYRLYYQTFKKEYGEAKGEFVLKELERRIKDGSLGDGVKLSKSSAEENGSDPKLNELHKAFLALQQSYIGDKEFLGGPVQKFTKKLLELNSGTNTALASALHCFGRYSGVAGALGKKRKSLVSMKKIGVQPMALARRKMVAGGRHRIGAGRPSKDCFTRRKETVPFSSQHMPTCRHSEEDQESPSKTVQSENPDDDIADDDNAKCDEDITDSTECENEQKTCGDLGENKESGTLEKAQDVMVVSGLMIIEVAITRMKGTTEMMAITEKITITQDTPTLNERRGKITTDTLKGVMGIIDEESTVFEGEGMMTIGGEV